MILWCPQQRCESGTDKFLLEVAVPVEGPWSLEKRKLQLCKVIIMLSQWSAVRRLTWLHLLEMMIEGYTFCYSCRFM